MLISFCVLVGKLIPIAVFYAKLSHESVNPYYNYTKEVLPMLKWCFPRQSKVTDLTQNSQSWLWFVRYFLVFQSSANCILNERRKILHYSINGVFQVYLDVWRSGAIICDQVGFCSKRVSSLILHFPFYQSQTQSTIPDLVKNGNLMVFWLINLKWTSASKPLIEFNHV